MQICISSTRFPSSLTKPPNQQEKEVERSLLASLNVESSRVHAAGRPSGLLGRIRQIRPTLDSAASRYAILDALCAARQCQARRLASHRPSVRSWVESIAEQNCGGGDGRQRSRGQALLNNLCNTKWPCSILIKGPYVHCSTHDLTPFSNLRFFNFFCRSTYLATYYQVTKVECVGSAVLGTLDMIDGFFTYLP